MADNKLERIVLPEVPSNREAVPADNFDKSVGVERAIEKPVLPSEIKKDKDKPKKSFNEMLSRFSSSSSSSSDNKDRQKKIDAILEDGLGEIFLNMPSLQQSAFKAEGENTVRKIDALLGKAKVKASKIFVLIKKWLSLIPGVNRFFLEQEAKIKTDRIMKINN